MSKTKVTLWIASVLLLPGCLFKSIDLEPRWRPLDKVYESGSIARGVTMTVDHGCYVHDLQAWQIANPVGSDEREALLLHEQVHSKRQLSAGPLWFLQYALDKKFMWQEEKLGYEIEITYLVQHHKIVDPIYMAQMMSGSVYGNMISFAEAEAWVRSVMEAADQ